MALSDATIRTLKPEGKRRELLIADTNGLYIRIRAGIEGRISRTWQWRRKARGEIRIVTLGPYPALSVREARLKAAELALKRQAHSPTVEEAAEQWLTERIDLTLKNAEPIRAYVERAIIPELGSRRVRDVEPADIAAHRAGIPRSRCKVGEGQGWRAAWRPRPARRAQRVVRLCRRKRLDPAVPAAPITHAVIGAPSKARARVLSDDEIKLVMATEAVHGPVLASCWRLAFASARPTMATGRPVLGRSFLVRKEQACAPGLARRVRPGPTGKLPMGGPKVPCAALVDGQCRRLDGARPAADLQHPQQRHGRAALHGREDAEPHVRRRDGGLQSRHIRRRAAAGAGGMVGLARRLRRKASRRRRSPASSAARGIIYSARLGRRSEHPAP